MYYKPVFLSFWRRLNWPQTVFVNIFFEQLLQICLWFQGLFMYSLFFFQYSHHCCPLCLLIWNRNTRNIELMLRCQSVQLSLPRSLLPHLSILKKIVLGNLKKKKRHCSGPFALHHPNHYFKVGLNYSIGALPPRDFFTTPVNLW